MSFMGWASQEEDLEIEKQKISFLEVYLPEMLTEEQLTAIVQDIIKQLAIEEPKKQRWQLIWPIMKQYGATVDGSMLNWIINSL
jgi:uncharacterized protein YqeY